MKKNIRKLPSLIEAKLESLDDTIVVGCVRHFSSEEIKKGLLSDYDIVIGTDGEPTGSGSHLPEKSAGRYSRYNLEGREFIRFDLPKENRQVPYHNVDWHGVPHSGTYPRQCYPKEVLEAERLSIEAKVIRSSLDGADVAFRIEGVLKTTAKNFQRSLMSRLNLLYENCRSYNVENANSPMEEYERFTNVNWKIFPKGVRSDEIFDMVAGRKIAASSDERRTFCERLEFLKQLGATSMVRGLDSFNGYVGAIFPDGICVFDNVNYGNAAYVLEGEWEILTKKSRTELRSQFKEQAIPINHTEDWRDKVVNAIRIIRAHRRLTP